ncbi:MAG: hypothetical protein AAFQ22_10445 [Pseudomonadota bacterium]
MTLETIYYVTQIIAVVAVVASLIFVGLQVRQDAEQTRLNTRALKATSHHAISDSFNHLNTTLATYPDLARIWDAGLQGVHKLNREELTAFHSILIAYVRIFETLYFQSENGTMAKELWEAEKRVLKFMFAMPGVQQWWALPLLPFSDAFRAEVEAFQA